MGRNADTWLQLGWEGNSFMKKALVRFRGRRDGTFVIDLMQRCLLEVDHLLGA